MASRALNAWLDAQLPALNQIEDAHAALEGVGPGRRFRTAQVNGAYVVLLAGQFQQFCRNLHSEAASFIAESLPTQDLKLAVLAAITQERQLDRGNANPSSLGTDFQRFNMRFWDEINRLDSRNRRRQEKLDELNIWRNAVAHQNFDFSSGQRQKLGNTRVTMRFIKGWRSACEALAVQFDAAVGTYLTSIAGSSPW